MAAYYERHDTAFFSGRTMFLIAVILIHIGLIYLFESGLATRIIHAAEPPIETNIVQDVKQRDAPPPPPPPKMDHPPVEVPPPDVVINLPAEPTTTAITNTTTKHVDAPPPPPPRAPDVRTRAQLDAKHSPPTDDYYPPTSRRMNETGSTTINVCLDDAGKMQGDPKVAKSSGSSRLDEAAVRWGSHARFVQGTLNGKPTAGCTEFLVTFRLVD
jgi:protein TonB